MLTKRQFKLVSLLAVGYSDKEAADALTIAHRTVVNHKANIFLKLGISKTTELVAWYWCQKFNEKFDLAELKKQAIAFSFLIFIIPSALSQDNVQYRYRNHRLSRQKIEFSSTRII